MALTPELMRLMTDDELFSACHAEINSLTTTDLELELLKRLEENTPKDRELEELLVGTDTAALKNFLEGAANYTVPELTAFADLLLEFDIETPEELKARLALGAWLREVARSPTSPLTAFLATT